MTARAWLWLTVTALVAFLIGATYFLLAAPVPENAVFSWMFTAVASAHARTWGTLGLLLTVVLFCAGFYIQASRAETDEKDRQQREEAERRTRQEGRETELKREHEEERRREEREEQRALRAHELEEQQRLDSFKPYSATFAVDDEAVSVSWGGPIDTIPNVLDPRTMCSSSLRQLRLQSFGEGVRPPARQKPAAAAAKLLSGSFGPRDK